MENLSIWQKEAREELLIEIRSEMPLYRKGKFEVGESSEFRKGRNFGLKEVRNKIDSIWNKINSLK